MVSSMNVGMKAGKIVGVVSANPYPVIVGTVVPVIAIVEPALAALNGKQTTPGRVAKYVFESKAVDLQIGRELLSQAHSQQFSALFQHQFKFFYANGPIDIVGYIAWRELQEPFKGNLQPSTLMRRTR